MNSISIKGIYKVSADKLTILAIHQKGKLKPIIFLAVIYLLASSSFVSANGPEVLPLRGEEKPKKVFLYPELKKYTRDNAFLFSLAIIIWKPHTPTNSCFEKVYFPYPIHVGNEMKMQRLSLKLTVNSADSGSVQDLSNERIPTADVHTEDPFSESLIKVNIKETGENEYNKFVSEIDEEYRDHLEKRFPKDRNWITFRLKHPKISGSCLNVTIINTGFLRLH